MKTPPGVYGGAAAGENGSKASNASSSATSSPGHEEEVMEQKDGTVPGAGPGDVLEEVRHQVAAEYLPVMATIRDQLISELEGIERAEVRWSRLP